jgi:hypothetical protein
MAAGERNAMASSGLILAPALVVFGIWALVGNAPDWLGLFLLAGAVVVGLVWFATRRTWR